MPENEILEGFPESIQSRLENRNRLRKANMPPYINGIAVELVLEDIKLWQVGVLKVSFKGGDANVHKKIADVASEWSEYGNIKFDFGYNKQNRQYRLWTPNDSSHIRVGFSKQGYWSLVGVDSMDDSILHPGDISLNFQDFDKALPANWKGIVLHEFGHALGFHHEHQSPVANCDFNWDVVYDQLSRSPNFWSKEKVDFNLRQMPAGGLTFSPHDKESIMHYSFPSWMFESREKF